MATKDAHPTKGASPLHITEQGNFAHASCECGWRGPARRSRKKARSDAASHLDERCRAVQAATG